MMHVLRSRLDLAQLRAAYRDASASSRRASASVRRQQFLKAVAGTSDERTHQVALEFGEWIVKRDRVFLVRHGMISRCPHITRFSQPQHRTGEGDTEQPVSGAQWRRAEGVLQERHIDDHDLQKDRCSHGGP
jgi:hypothetical protein